MEIGPSGTTMISGPAVITPEGSTPVTYSQPPAQPKPASHRLAQVAPLLDQAGSVSALSPKLLEAVAWAESRFRTSAISPKGAVGLMQLMPATASELGVDASNPEQNARGGAIYLRRMLALFDGNVELALAAYNAGPAAVIAHRGVPPFAETKAYVAAVLDYLASDTISESQ